MAAHERRLNMMGKPVFLHQNGDSFMKKRLVVNQREMRSFESFLEAAGRRFRIPAREIRTPGGRHRIKNLDDLKRDGSYVVVGREPFKKIEYEGKEIKPPRFGTVKFPEINFVQLNHRKYGRIQGRARISGLRKKEETKTIVVFCNGLVAKPKRVQLKTDFKMFQVLEAVNDKVSHVSKYGAVFDLFSTDGRLRISEPSQLEDNGQYVAVGRERFFDRTVPYDDQGVASQLTPRRASTRPRGIDVRLPRKHRALAKRSTKEKSLVPDDGVANEMVPAVITSRDEHGNTTPEYLVEAKPVHQFDNVEVSSDEDVTPDRIEQRLRAFADDLRQDSDEEQQNEDVPVEENITDKIVDVLGDHGVPLEELMDAKKDNADAEGRVSQGRSSRNEGDQEDDEVKPSVYKASGEGREDAREILDDKETVEDKPIDQVPAEEVADEEMDENAENRKDAEDEVSNRGAEEQPDNVAEENIETKSQNSEPVEPTPPKESETSDAQQQ